MKKLVEIAREASARIQPAYLAGLENEDRAREYGITTPLRQAHFLAQVFAETGGGFVLQENMSYTAARMLEIFGVGRHSAKITPAEAETLARKPELLAERVYGAGNPRKMAELGNRPGDGFPFRGTGPMQSTGRAAAKAWGDKLGVAFAENVALMLAPRWVMMPPLFEWQKINGNRLADQNDIRAIRRAINGGYNGMAHAEEWFDKLWKIARRDSDPEEAWQAPRNADEGTRWLQDALNDLGAEPPLKVDGRYGPRTRAAVVWFQTLAGLKADGVAGPVTRQALHVRLSAVRGDANLEGLTEAA